VIAFAGVHLHEHLDVVCLDVGASADLSVEPLDVTRGAVHLGEERDVRLDR
jgi:hypothetical protein